MNHRRAWNLIDCMLALTALLFGTSASFQLSQSSHRHHRLHREYAIAWRVLTQVSRHPPTQLDQPLHFDQWGVQQATPSHHLLTCRVTNQGASRIIYFNLTFRDSQEQIQNLSARRHIWNSP